MQRCKIFSKMQALIIVNLTQVFTKKNDKIMAIEVKSIKSADIYLFFTCIL